LDEEGPWEIEVFGGRLFCGRVMRARQVGEVCRKARADGQS